MSLLGYGLIAFGAVVFALGSYLERWHSQRFEEHTSRLEELYLEGEDDKVSKELQEFHNDKRIDYAIDGMVICHGLGIIALGMGFFLLVR